MLNEIKEYEQYTYPLDAKHPAKRLKHRALCNELSGTARAMTIIARKSISEYEGPVRVDHAIRVLQVWCGDPKGDPETISEKIEYAWLPNYMIQILGEEKALKFEDYLMKETSLKSFPRYKEVCSLFRDIHADFNFDTIRTKSKREPYLNKAKKISLYSKELGELGDDEGKKNQRKKTSSAYSPVYNIIKALVVLNGRFGTRGYKQKMFNDNLPIGSKLVKNYFVDVVGIGFMTLIKNEKLNVFVANSTSEAKTLNLGFFGDKTFECKLYNMSNLGTAIQGGHINELIVPAYSGICCIEN